MTHYEAVFIITPVLSDAQVKEAVQKFKQLISDNGGKVVHEEDWGLKKMAYPVQKKTTGFYQLLQFDAPGELINTLEINFRRDERIIRFLTVRLDKYAYEYAEKRKKRNIARKTAKKEKK